MSEEGLIRRRGGDYPRRAHPPRTELWQETTKAVRLGARKGKLKKSFSAEWVVDASNMLLCKLIKIKLTMGGELFVHSTFMPMGMHIFCKWMPEVECCIFLLKIDRQPGDNMPTFVNGILSFSQTCFVRLVVEVMRYVPVIPYCRLNSWYTQAFFFSLNSRTYTMRLQVTVPK